MTKYVLAVPTNGRPCLRETLESFREHVRPAPLRVLALMDGTEVKPWGGGESWPGIPWISALATPALGFCYAARELWRMVVRDEEAAEFAFWLEDDFVFERDVDLDELADVLRENERLTQMALMRGPANDVEAAAGGCRQLRPWAYHERDGGRWLESFTNHSTTCSLIRRAFMAGNPWPDYPENCEGLFSQDLLRAGRSFGVWGLGETWIRHVGARSGFGY